MLESLSGRHSIAEVCDLSFNEQVFIWALRMRVRGDYHFEKVIDHCEKHLPPAAARVALKSINVIIDAVRNYGRRALTLNCTCMPALTHDELMLVNLYRKANDWQTGIDNFPLSNFVFDEGQKKLDDGMRSLHVALATLDKAVSNEKETSALDNQKRRQIISSTSSMVH